MKNYFKKLWDMTAAVSEQTGYSRGAVLWAYGLAFLRCGAAIDEFRVCRLYDDSALVQRNGFLSGRRMKRAVNRLCREATREELDSFGRKERFNRAFADHVYRDWIYAGDSTRQQLKAFLDRNPVFLAKEVGSTQGKNITRWTAGTFDREAFLKQYLGKTFVLEAMIVQASAMAAINPSSVNTVRLVTVSCGDRTEILGGCLRTGGAGAFVDNFHSGGIAFPLDMETGVVCGMGQDFAGRRYSIHPATGVVVLGFSVPHWPLVCDAVRQSARRFPRVGCIGWDVAVTEEGVEFIEGNVNYPDHTLLQLERNDGWKRLRELQKAFKSA